MIPQPSFAARRALFLARRASLVALLLLAACGTERFYEGAKLPPEDIAVIHVGDTIVLRVDGKGRRGGFFGSPRVAVAPGQHTLTLAFEKQARSVGAKEMPAMRGEGTCTLEVAAEAGKQYWLGAQAVGEDWTGLRWDGKWRAWVRDPSVTGEDDIVARCDSEPIEENPPAPTTEAEERAAVATPVPAGRPAPVPAPAVGAAAPAAALPPAPFSGGLDPAVWIVRSRDNYRVVVRRFCSVNRCSTLSYLQTLIPRSVVSDGVERVVMEEKTTVPIQEVSEVSSFVEDVQVVDRQGAFAFEMQVANADDPEQPPVRWLVYPLPDGGYRVSETSGGP